jgi:phosphohistidine phosphatase
MKELILIRHGKSSWKGDLPDHERPLAPRGERDAPEMGRRLVRTGSVPERIVTSDAERARATAVALAGAAGLPVEAVVEEPRLYHAGADEIPVLARALDDGFDRVALVGHNPALQMAAERLCGLHAEKLPTAAVVRIHFAIDRWADLPDQGGTCIEFDYPKKRGA